MDSNYPDRHTPGSAYSDTRKVTMHLDHIKVIGFDADDTLWLNESYFLETELKLYDLLKPYADTETVSKELFCTRMQNSAVVLWPSSANGHSRKRA